MALPKIESPKFVAVFPTGEEYSFRPFVVKEQKALLITSEGGSSLDIFKGIVDLVDKCTFEKIDWLSQPTVNLEHAFLHIRSKSVGEVVEITYQCKSQHEGDKHCNHKNMIEVDVRTATSQPFPENKISVTNSITMVMQHLTVKDTMDMMAGLSNEDLITRKVEMVIDGENVITEFNKTELMTFIDSFPTKAAEQLKSFFEDQPTLVLKQNTKCAKCGNESFIQLKGVLNFFG